MSLSALQSWKPARCSAESGISPLSHVSVNHKTADEGKSLLFPNSSCNSSSLLGSERTLERNIPGKGVTHKRTGPPPSPAFHCVSKGMRTFDQNVGNKSSGVVTLMFLSSSLVK